MTDTRVLLDPILQRLDADFDGVRVAALGGGHGLAVALRAMLDYAGDITAIVSVGDDGGSSGRLAPALDIPPMGDIRRALLALSPDETLWRALMEFRFEGSDVAGHSLGNLLIAALTEIRGDFEEALHVAGSMLGARGTVVPVASVPLTLEAEVGGEKVTGQVAIATSRGGITSLDVHPEDAPATGAALRAIAGADQIVLGPGSLFTSVIAGLRVSGIAEAINGSAAKLVYVCNLITQDGETLGMNGEAHVRALVTIGGLRPPDVVVAHEGAFDVPPGLDAVKMGTDGPWKVETADLVDHDAEWPAHDAVRLSGVLRALA